MGGEMRLRMVAADLAMGVIKKITQDGECGGVWDKKVSKKERSAALKAYKTTCTKTQKMLADIALHIHNSKYDPPVDWYNPWVWGGWISAGFLFFTTIVMFCCVKLGSRREVREADKRRISELSERYYGSD